ncbi:single-stranded DNA-binding protein [Belliella kenyensis]|uniref:Single-stranded DNA-binding protein n=1 Tax=Belliella kenyensis TaxID=1472724 RepID=A0ABV8EHV1_9BACT|nr:single-stranded DNA-binding protein [Belliella kenyensis]MCH7401437.1 single-stranded DNA-binding protein [Belliella kenyensis]MDN3602880.1 single-stranded DNA-binding protein [Belliella kenyensis]
MAGGVNKVILVGNLGQDPEVRHLEGDKVVANVSLATTESYKDRSGNRVDNTEWHDLELWDGLAKIAENYLKKGSKIYVEGKIKTDSWQDEQGNNRRKVRIRVQNLTMLDARTDGQGSPSNSSSNQAYNNNPSPQQMPAPNVAEGPADDDDLPF